MAVLLLVTLVFALAGGTLLVGYSVVPVLPDPGQAAFSFDFTQQGTADVLIVTHDGGGRLKGDRLTVVIEDAVPVTADGSYGWTEDPLDGQIRVQSGDSVTLDPTTVGDETRLDLDRAEVRVVRRVSETDRSFVLARWEGPKHDDGGRSPPSAEAVSTIDETEAIVNDRKLSFHVSAAQDVTVTGFALTTKASGDMALVESLGGSGNDVVIDPSGGTGEGSADESGAGFATDGTWYALDTNATVPADETANVTLSDFLYANGSTYTFNPGDPEFRASSGPWDVAVTLVFRDGSDVTFYVDVPS